MYDRDELRAAMTANIAKLKDWQLDQEIAFATWPAGTPSNDWQADLWEELLRAEKERRG